MSVYSKIEDAEGLIREALINALAEGEDQYLTDLFNLLNNAKSTLDKIAEIGFNEAGNSITFDTSDPNYNFTLSSDYLDQITFPAGDIAIGTGNADVISFLNGLTGNNNVEKVSFGTEGGLFSNQLNIETAICGPGSMDQGHKPNEYIEKTQIDLCDQMLENLLDKLEKGL